MSQHGVRACQRAVSRAQEDAAMLRRLPRGHPWRQHLAFPGEPVPDDAPSAVVAQSDLAVRRLRLCDIPPCYTSRTESEQAEFASRIALKQ
jgi:hypothetical protein